MTAVSRADSGPTRITERNRRFYIVAIWMPIIVPLVCALGFALRGWRHLEGFGADVGRILIISGYTTGVPYLVFALWATDWLRRAARTEREVRRLMWTAPLIVSVIALPWWTVIMGIQNGIDEAFMVSVLFYIPFLLAIGYLYVTLTALTDWVRPQRRALADEPKI